GYFLRQGHGQRRGWAIAREPAQIAQPNPRGDPHGRRFLPLRGLNTDEFWITRLRGPSRPIRMRLPRGTRRCRRHYHRLPSQEIPMTITFAHIPPLFAPIAGILILLFPRLLNYVVAIYLIIVGIAGLNSIHHFIR